MTFSLLHKCKLQISLNHDSLSPGHEPGTDVGPLISPAAKQRVEHLVESGVKEGWELMLDGRGVTVPGYESGNFVGPTVLHKVLVSFMDDFCKLLEFYKNMHHI